MLELIMAMLMTHSQKGAIPAERLAPAIKYAAERNNVDPILVTQILLVESGGIPGAYNKDSDDHGLMQINERTRVAYGISKWCTKQWQCNLNSATRILADMQRISNFRNCVYNVGPRGRLPQYETACLRYERKLNRMVVSN